MTIRQVYKAQHRAQHGFTLIEMMVAMAISSILIAVVAVAYTAQSSGYNNQQEMINLQQNVRSSLLFLAREIRMAGYDPTGDADATITTASGTQFRFTQDISDGSGGVSDGDTNDSNEDIRFALNGSNSLGRETGGGGGLQPIADNIMQLAFEYYMEDETWTQAPGGLDDIRAVKVMLLGRSAREKSDSVDTSTFTPPLESAFLDWTPANPGHHHWRLMSIIVQCRNMGLKE